MPSREFKPDKNTIILYHFNEGKGTTTVDESEYKNDGEITNAEWVKSDAPIGPAAINNTKDTLSTTWGWLKQTY